MATDVTFGGVGGTTGTVSFTSSQNAQMAQAALSGVQHLISTGAMSVSSPPPGIGANATAPGGGTTYSGIFDSVPGYAGYGSVPSNNNSIIVTDPPFNTLSAIGSHLSTTVIAGNTSTVVFVNNDTSSLASQVFLGGGTGN